MSFTKRERLLGILSGSKVDRPAVIMPGGLINSASYDIMDSAGFTGQPVSTEPAAIAALSLAVTERTGLESLGLPFCMTVESEAYGGETEAGASSDLPPDYEFTLRELRDQAGLKPLDPYSSGRLPVVVEAMESLRRERAEMPLIADLVGPVSLATSLIDSRTLFKGFINYPDLAHALLQRLVDGSVSYLRALAAAGSDVVFITDPASDIRTLGAGIIEEFSSHYINILVDAASECGMPSVVHICGSATPFPGLGATAISIDGAVPVGERSFIVAGGVGAGLLEGAEASAVRSGVSEAVSRGVDLVAPSCGLTGAVREANLTEMVRVVRNM